MARPAPEIYPTARRANAYVSTSAVAHAVSPSVRDQSFALMEQTPTPQSTPRAPFQPALFTTREIGRVVPIEFYQKTETAVPRPQRTSPSVRARHQNDTRDLAELQQQAFDFQTVPAVTARTSPGPVSRKTPVAVPVHRLLAGALDASMIAVGVALMALAVHLAVGLSFLGGLWPAALAGTAGFVALLYKLLWICAETESPGLRWVQLRLVNFDGKSPSRRQRLERFGWSGVSFAAGCLGLLWSLVDEESLTWHDHSSKTFLTCFTSPAR
ncbi:MAG: RDD family protein [Bryobacteraceae bacterium]